MNVLDRRQDLINSLTHKDKVTIAISVIEEEIKKLNERLKETDDLTTRRIINQMIYELDSVKDYL